MVSQSRDGDGGLRSYVPLSTGLDPGGDGQARCGCNASRSAPSRKRAGYRSVPIPLAGFNLGKYKIATVQAGSVTVETYATAGVERDFPNAPIETIPRNPNEPASLQRVPRKSLLRKIRRQRELSCRWRKRRPRDPVFCGALWALSLQPPGTHADARPGKSGMARAGVSFFVCVSD